MLEFDAVRRRMSVILQTPSDTARQPPPAPPSSPLPSPPLLVHVLTGLSTAAPFEYNINIHTHSILYLRQHGVLFCLDVVIVFMAVRLICIQITTTLLSHTRSTILSVLVTGRCVRATLPSLFIFPSLFLCLSLCLFLLSIHLLVSNKWFY